jgi:tetratricopeptide (TPR) repeat protein
MNRDDLARREDDLAFVRRSLVDLDAERAAGDLAEDDYVDLRARYDARLAVLTDEVAEGKQALPTAKRRRLSRSLARIGLVGVVAVGAGLFVARSAGLRLPSDGVTGGNVRDTNQLLVEARSALGTDRPGALKRFRQVLETQPDNAEARTYAAWITRLDTREAVTSGTLDPAKARPIFEGVDTEFDQAAASQPALADPHCFQAVLRFRDLDDPVRSRQAYEACLSTNPNQMVLGLVSKVGPEIDAALATNADAVVAGMAQARVALAAGDIVGSLKRYDGVVKVDPANNSAVTWSAWLQARLISTALQSGQIAADFGKDKLAKAEATIDAVRTASPTFSDAACAKVVFALNRDDTAAANAAVPTCRVGVASPEIRDAALSSIGTPVVTSVP